VINRKEHLAVSQPILKDGKEALELLEAEIDAGLLKDKSLGFTRVSVTDYHPRVIDAIAELYKANGWGVEVMQWGSFCKDSVIAVYW